MDTRWLLAGATALIVVAVVAISLLSGTFTGGGSGAVPVGRVAETTPGTTAQEMLSVGATAPDLRWTLSGQAGSVAGERGHPLMLVFFATWCPHCQAEVATLNAVQSRFADQGLRTIGISASPFAMDQRGASSLGDVELFVKQHGAQYPHLFDSGLVGAQRYGVRGFPTMYLIGADGTIRYARSGEVPEADLAQAVQSALAAT